MKSKLLRPLIITGILLVVLAGIYYFTTFIAPEPEENSPSPTVDLRMTNGVVTELKRVTVDLKEEKDYEIAVDATVTPRKYEVFPPFPGFSYDNNRITTLVNSLMNLQAMELVMQEPSEADLQEYGLIEPASRVTAVFTGGEKQELLIGNSLVIGGAYYAMVEGSDKVYTISEENARVFLNREDYLRSLDIMPPKKGDEAASTVVSRFTMNRPNADPIVLRRRTPEEIDEYGDGASTFELLSPIPYNVSDSVVSDEFLAKVLVVYGKSIVEDNPADLSKYGLDNPIEVYVESVDGKEYNILFGESGGKTYAMKKGVPSVILVADEYYEFFKVKDLDLLLKLLWMYNINEVTKVEFDMNGKKYSLDIDSDPENQIFEASLNGKDISENNARRLYQRAISFRIVGRVEQEVTAEPQHRISIHMRSGDVHRLNLIPLNDRQFAAELDGKVDYYVHINDLKSVIEAFGIIDKGETIPLM